MKKSAAFIFLVLLLTWGCNNPEENDQQETSEDKETTVVSKNDYKDDDYESDVTYNTFDPEAVLKIDLNQDLEGKTLEELRLMRNSLYARQGHLFMKADLRGFFGKTDWYNDEMYKRWEAEDMGEDYPKISFNKEEQAFLDKVLNKEKELLKQNFVERNGRKVANINNVINYFQFTNINDQLIQKLDENGFVIVPQENIQLFHVYEQNDYQQVPNFVTTDLYLQVFHMYFSYMLKSLEKDKFIPAMTALSEQFYDRSVALVDDPELGAHAAYTATYFAVPYYLLTGKKKAVPAAYLQQYEEEIQKCMAAEDKTSAFLGYDNIEFAYSLFKPRGHYTRNETLKKYFRAMMWLQTTPFCREKDKELQRAVFIAQLFRSNSEMMRLYKSVYEPITFLIGETDNLSVTDIIDALEKNNQAKDMKVAADKDVLAGISDYLKSLSDKNKIGPKGDNLLSCKDKINFMPQRYLPDNAIIQDLVDTDTKPETKRAYPKGLDVMAGFGSASAEDILLNELNEDEKWDKYKPRLDKLKQQFDQFDGWNNSVYNKWIETLLTMQSSDKNYPYFMQSKAWSKKNLNTSLASWAELKHDAILYGEQPMGAECGGGGPPEPITVGYVEPNVKFWKKIGELLSLTEDVLKRNGLYTSDLQSKTKQMKEKAAFLLSASEKELRGEKLSDQEYQSIEVIGSSYEYLTLSVVDPDKYFDSWNNIEGPDKSVAVVADIYTANANNNPKKGILHVATGFVNDIYVVVEIEGYLYLTKGATFSYHEFPRPMGTRLTDEEWQKMLENNTAPDVPEWMKDIMLQREKAPKPDEKIFYSSGC